MALTESAWDDLRVQYLEGLRVQGHAGLLASEVQGVEQLVLRRFRCFASGE